MSARKVCQNFFHDALAPFHQYRQNALLDATVALTRGASLTLTRIGRHLSGPAQVKNKIKRVDRLLGNASLSQIVPSKQRQNAEIQKTFLNSLAQAYRC